MASSVVYRDMNVVGNRIEDEFEVTFTSTTDEAAVVTRLNVVEHCDVFNPAGDDMDIAVYLNEDSASSDEDVPGTIFLDSTTSAQNPTTYYFRVIGW